MSFSGLRIVEDNPYNSMAPSGAMSQHPSLNESFFNSPGLSLALKTGIDGQGDVSGTKVVTDENYETNNGSGGIRRSRDELEHEYRSGSDNLDGVSGDDHDVPDNFPRKKKMKRYHRHTPQQIQELESVFKECPHPDEKQRLELSKRLCLETRQVKFWFQNRRTMMKTQLERHENSLLRQENDKLRAENMSIRETIRNPICSNCGGPTILSEFSMEEHQLRIENGRLKEEIDRLSSLANKFLARPISSLSTLSTLSTSITPQMPSSALELGVNRTNYFNPLTNPFPLPPDFATGPVLSPTKSTANVASVDRSFERSMYLELALGAMDELVKMAQVDEPLWLTSLEPGGREILNHDEYMRCFTPCTGFKPNGYVTEATRQTGVVILNSLALVETLMDPNRWVEMFPGLIAGTSTMEVISSGMGGTKNGLLQLMHAELQVLSPLVPVRVVNFLRFCKQHAEGVWAVVDVSVDFIRESSGSPAYINCRRLPSGCVIQDMPNGCSKVTWVEHAEYDENGIHDLYRPLVSSGFGFGALKWLTTLQRQSECLATIMSSSVTSDDHTGITTTGRRTMMKLAQRMTNNFSAGICATTMSTKWSKLDMAGGNVDENVQVMTRKNMHEPGEPPGIVLSAVTSVWLPVSHQRLFDFLRDERLRSEWDILSNGSPMHEIVRVSKSRDNAGDSGGDNGDNCVSILRASQDMNTNQSSMLILQETCNDITGSLVVYAPIDIPAMHVLMSGADSDQVSLLPSGFAIAPGSISSEPDCNGSTTTTGLLRPSGGSLLTVGFQILVNSLPTAKLTVESVETVSHLISCTLQKIKGALV